MHNLSSVLFFFYLYTCSPFTLPVTFCSWCISSEEPEVCYRPRLISDQVSECPLEVEIAAFDALISRCFLEPEVTNGGRLLIRIQVHLTYAGSPTHQLTALVLMSA
jgi:hypothetical protein